MITLICFSIAAVAYLAVVVVHLRAIRHTAAIRRLIEQNDYNVANMRQAMNDEDWDKFDRYYWRSLELGELIDREIEKV